MLASVLPSRRTTAFATPGDPFGINYAGDGQLVQASDPHQSELTSKPQIAGCACTLFLVKKKKYDDEKNSI
jgi:hypothetical protein